MRPRCYDSFCSVRQRAGGAAFAACRVPLEDPPMLRTFCLPLSLLVLAVAWPCAAQPPQIDLRHDADPPQTVTDENGSLGTLRPTPEMWFYEQEMRRHDDPKLAVRRAPSCAFAAAGAAGRSGLVRHVELAPDRLAHAVVRRLFGRLGLEHLRSVALAHPWACRPSCSSRPTAINGEWRRGLSQFCASREAKWGGPRRA